MVSKNKTNDKSSNKNNKKAIAAVEIPPFQSVCSKPECMSLVAELWAEADAGHFGQVCADAQVAESATLFCGTGFPVSLAHLGQAVQEKLINAGPQESDRLVFNSVAMGGNHQLSVAASVRDDPSVELKLSVSAAGHVRAYHSVQGGQALCTEAARKIFSHVPGYDVKEFPELVAKEHRSTFDCVLGQEWAGKKDMWSNIRRHCSGCSHNKSNDSTKVVLPGGGALFIFSSGNVSIMGASRPCVEILPRYLPTIYASAFCLSGIHDIEQARKIIQSITHQTNKARRGRRARRNKNNCSPVKVGAVFTPAIRSDTVSRNAVKGKDRVVIQREGRKTASKKNNTSNKKTKLSRCYNSEDSDDESDFDSEEEDEDDEDDDDSSLMYDSDDTVPSVTSAASTVVLQSSPLPIRSSTRLQSRPPTNYAQLGAYDNEDEEDDDEMVEVVVSKGKNKRRAPEPDEVEEQVVAVATTTTTVQHVDKKLCAEEEINKILTMQHQQIQDVFKQVLVMEQQTLAANSGWMKHGEPVVEHHHHHHQQQQQQESESLQLFLADDSGFAFASVVVAPRVLYGR